MPIQEDTKQKQKILNLVRVSFYWQKHKEQTICLRFQKVSNFHGWNVELENLPTRKCRDDVSRGNFGMDATP